MESIGDSATHVDYDKNIEVLEDPTRDMIINYFNNKNYFISFMVFNIISQEVFNVDNVTCKTSLNEKRLNHLMRNIDENTCSIFSKTFNLDIKEVENAAKTCNSLSNTRTYTAIRRNLRILAQKE